MTHLLRSAAVAAAAVLIVSSAGCAAMTVSSHVDRMADFGLYRTWDWGPADALPVGDPRLESDPFFNDRFRGAVERRLAARGWTLTSDTPDLLIHYHANVAEHITLNRVDPQYGSCSRGDCEEHAVNDQAGTLVLDIIDAKTSRLVWRGWAQHEMDGVIGNRDRMEQTIDRAVTRMLKQLPRTL